MCPAATSTTMPSGYLHSVTMTLWSEPSGFSDTTVLSLRSRRNRWPTVALSPDARRGFCICELTMCPYSRYQLGSEPGARFTSEPRISIVARPSDAVDVTGNSDRQRGLSAVTTSLRRSHGCWDDGELSRFALADSRLTTSFGRCSIRLQLRPALAGWPRANYDTPARPWRSGRGRPSRPCSGCSVMRPLL